MPVATMLSTTPAMIWSIRQRTVVQARKPPATNPLPTPARTPTRIDPLYAAAKNPANAAMSICPSMPMLTTPERSPMTPTRAARTSGMA